MGGIKLTQNDVIKLVASKNGTFIKEEVIKNKRTITIKCNKDNHIWSTNLYNLKKGKWCKVCFNNKNNINRTKISKLILSKGYLLLTSGSLNRKSKFKVNCPIHDLAWETCYGNLKYMSGNCKLCSAGYPSINVVMDFIKNRDGVLIERVKRSNEDTRNLIVKCTKHNHIWKTQWSILQKGTWCIKCSLENKTIKYAEIKTLIESKNAVLLTKDCSSATQKIKVKCLRDDYEWITTWSRINQSCWCPRCSGMERYTINRVRNIIKERGGELLDSYINNIKQNVNIKCNCGNIFLSTLHHIINHNLWCQVCGPRSKNQKLIYDILKEFFPNYNIKYNYRGFSWLKSNKKNTRRMEIDIWIPEIKLAVEYDGEQHFKPIKFASTMTDEQAKKSFHIIKRHDRKKTKLIASHPNIIKYFIRFNYKDCITKKLILDRLGVCGSN